MNNTDILLVGGNGYLGSHLAERLAQSIKGSVFVTGRQYKTDQHYLRIDFSDTDSFENLAGRSFDIVVVLAAALSSLGTTDLAHRDLRSNVIDYASFLEFLNVNKVAKKIVYISSMTVYDADNTSPVDETSALSPASIYGLSKSMAETVTKFFCTANKIPGVILRLPGIYGGQRKSGFIYNTIRKCLTGENILLNTKGLVFWETIYIEDLCVMLDEFIHKYDWLGWGNIFNISYGEECDFYKTVFFIRDQIGSLSKIETEGSKGYAPFFLSNQKMKQFISVRNNYYDSLRDFITSITV